MRALGVAAGEVLRTGGYVIEAARAIGVPMRTFNDWLDGTDDAAVAFADGVLGGYAEAARKGEEEAFRDIMGSADKGPSGPHSSFHRWRLEKRWPRVFGGQRVEVTGKDGGPVQHQDVTNMTAGELVGLVQAAEDDE